MTVAAPTRAQATVPGWAFSALYVVLLLCLPTRLVVGPLGSVGTPANLLGIGLLIWWLCAALGRLNQTRGPTPMRVFVGLCTVTVLASFAAGHTRGWYQPIDVEEATSRVWVAATVPEVTATLTSAADRGLLAFAGWIGVLLFTSESIRSWEELEKLVRWIVGAGSVVATMGIVQYATRLNVAGFIRIPGLQALTEFGDALSRSDLNRIVSTSAHPIELGVALACLLPLAIHVGLHSRRIWGWLPTVLIGSAALMSVSRSAVVVAGVGMVVLMIGWPWKRRLIAFALIPVGAVVARAVFPGLLGTLRALFGALDVDPSISGRTDDYPFILEIFVGQPVLGQGLFTFIPSIFRTLDNQILLFLLELGVVGTLLFGLLFVAGVLCAWSPWLRHASAQQRHLGLALSAALLSVLSSYVTFDALSFRQVAGLTFLFLGLSGAVWRLSQDQPSRA